MAISIEWDPEVYLPVYQEINESGADVLFYWGGRDSGKSYDIALKLIEKCLTSQTFKCILIRKTHASIQESQWELIKSIVYDFGLEELFHFTKSPLEIQCTNGNRFIARGLDTPHNIKSVTDPTDAWYEEADKISFSDYQTVSTSLRSNEVQIQEWISFNPESEGNFEDHWLFKFVGFRYGKTEAWVNVIVIDGEEIPVNYISCHSTFDDNEYCPPQRKAKYISTTEGNDYKYNVFIHGRWGNAEIKSPFLLGFNKDKHVGKTALNRNAQALVLIDFNVNPFSASIFNSWHDGIPHLHQVGEIEVLNGTIQKMANEIESILGDGIYSARFGGDFMGSHGKVGLVDNRSLFQELQRALGVSWSQFELVPNPRHKTSREQCAYFLQNFPDLTIGEHCKESLRDYRVVQCDNFGSIIKQNRKDTAQLADHLDNFRYCVNTFYRDQIESHKRTGFW